MYKLLATRPVLKNFLDPKIKASRWSHLTGLRPFARAYHGFKTVAPEDIIDRAEPCLVSKSICNTHKPTYFVPPPEKSDLRMENEKLFRNLGIVPSFFTFDHPSNIANLNHVLPMALHDYGLFAITPSLPTLDQFITLVKAKNEEQDQRQKETKHLTRRPLYQDGHTVFADIQYELVVLSPELFLSGGRSLTICSRETNDGALVEKQYIVGFDNTLREKPGKTTKHLRLPSLSVPPRSTINTLNPFLIAMNAEDRFRQRRHALQDPVPSVVELMDKTTELVELVYSDVWAKVD